MIENRGHLLIGQGAELLPVAGHPIDQPRDIACHVAVLHLIVEHSGSQIQEVVAAARRPGLATLDCTAPQWIDQTVEVRLRQLLDLDVAQLGAQGRELDPVPAQRRRLERVLRRQPRLRRLVDRYLVGVDVGAGRDAACILASSSRAAFSVAKRRRICRRSPNWGSGLTSAVNC